MGGSKKSKSTSSLTDKALSPAAKTFGTELAPLGAEVGRAVNEAVKTLLLRPVSGAVWGANQVFDFIQEKVTKRFEKIPPENRVEADLRIAGPAMEAVRFAANEEDIQELFAALIANSMDSRHKGFIHPSYVDVVKQLSSTDAIIMKNIASSERIAIIKYSAKTGSGKIPVSPTIINPNFCSGIDVYQVSQSIDNLSRLMIIQQNFLNTYVDKQNYEFSKCGNVYEIFKKKSPRNRPRIIHKGRNCRNYHLWTATH
ncbi:MAG: DUF4393 domain-containing protein [Proteobacteria bacterium]|nr:DUF4393 domain-containing protein [Pseudomonadota bacterium]